MKGRCRWLCGCGLALFLMVSVCLFQLVSWRAELNLVSPTLPLELSCIRVCTCTCWQHWLYVMGEDLVAWCTGWAQYGGDCSECYLVSSQMAQEEEVLMVRCI